MLRTLVSAMLVLAAVSVSPPLALAQGQTTTAGGQSCITWSYAENRQGVSSRPQLTFVNTCARPVTAYFCTTTVFQSGGGRQPCDPRFSSYWNRTIAARTNFVMSTSGGGSQVVVIRECPNGYNRIPNGNVSNFPCALS